MGEGGNKDNGREKGDVRYVVGECGVVCVRSGEG